MADNQSQSFDFPQDFVRQTTHTAVPQTRTAPAATTQNIDSYQPPINQAPTQAQPQQPTPPYSQAAPVTPEPAPQPTQATQSTPPQNTPQPPVQESALFPGVAKQTPEELVVEWTAASRPFKPRKRQYFTTVILMAVLISLILFFANQFLPILVVLAVAFLSYVLAVVPPGMVKHSLTTYGIRIEDQLYYWEELGRFWFTTKYGQNILHIEVARFPWRLSLLLGDISVDQMSVVLSEVLIKQKPPLTPIERAAEWLQDKIPLE